MNKSDMARPVQGEDESPAPLVTIITATFNAASVLAQCIESVRAQGDPGLEHIVIDGGSTDATVDVIRAYEDDLSAWISEPDRGVYDAWNKGLALANGEWIAFLGADDLLLPDAMLSYRASIRSNPGAEYISSRIRHVRKDGGFRVIGNPWSWPRFQRFMTVAHPGSLHARSLFDRLGIYDTNYRITGDYELLLRARSELRAVYLPQITVEMAAGGISESMGALVEASRAKRISGGRSALTVAVDDVIARAKHRLRKAVHT